MKTKNVKVINGLGPIVNVLFSTEPNNPNPNRPEEDTTSKHRRDEDEKEKQQRDRGVNDIKNDVENLPMDEDNKNQNNRKPDSKHPGKNPM